MENTRSQLVTCVLHKNNYSCTNVVDGVKGDTQIANLFKDKYERLFYSV